MFYTGLILAMQSVIVWRVFQNEKRITEAINLLGDIKMKQEDFDKQVAVLHDEVSKIDTNLETESGEIKENFTALRDEIARLKATQGDNLDTSKLDEISNRLESSAQRISGLVDPLTVSDQTPPIGEPAAQVPATTVDAQPSADAPTEEFPAADVPVAATTADEAPADAVADDTSGR